MHQQCVIWVLPLVFFDLVAAFPRESGTPRALFPCRVAIAGLKSWFFCAKWNIPLPPLRGAEPEAPQVLHPALWRESVVRTLSRGPQGPGTLSGVGCSHCRQGAPATFVCKSILHCSRGAGEQLASSLHMMAQLPCTCSFQQTRRLGGGLPFCTGNARATSLITQHCHFKQPISRGKNLIISGESSSLFGWKNVGGGGGWQARHADEAGEGHGKGCCMAPAGERAWGWGPAQDCWGWRGWRYGRSSGMPERNAVAQENLQPHPRAAQGGWRDAAHAAWGLESSSRCRKSKRRGEENMQRFRAPGPRAGGERSCCSWETLGQPRACPQVG